MLGYPTGLQLWDCSNLSSVAELLNLTGSQWGAVEFAGILPDPPRAATDELRQKRPLVAFSYVCYFIARVSYSPLADLGLYMARTFLYIHYARTKLSRDYP